MSQCNDIMEVITFKANSEHLEYVETFDFIQILKILTHTWQILYLTMYTSV